MGLIDFAIGDDVRSDPDRLLSADFDPARLMAVADMIGERTASIDSAAGAGAPNPQPLLPAAPGAGPLPAAGTNAAPAAAYGTPGQAQGGMGMDPAIVALLASGAGRSSQPPPMDMNALVEALAARVEKTLPARRERTAFPVIEDFRTWAGKNYPQLQGAPMIPDRVFRKIQQDYDGYVALQSHLTQSMVAQQRLDMAMDDQEREKAELLARFGRGAIGDVAAMQETQAREASEVERARIAAQKPPGTFEGAFVQGALDPSSQDPDAEARLVAAYQRMEAAKAAGKAPAAADINTFEAGIARATAAGETDKAEAYYKALERVEQIKGGRQEKSILPASVRGDVYYEFNAKINSVVDAAGTGTFSGKVKDKDGKTIERKVLDAGMLVRARREFDKVRAVEPEGGAVTETLQRVLDNARKQVDPDKVIGTVSESLATTKGKDADELRATLQFWLGPDWQEAVASYVGTKMDAGGYKGRKGLRGYVSDHSEDEQTAAAREELERLLGSPVGAGAGAE